MTPSPSGPCAERSSSGSRSSIPQPTTAPDTANECSPEPSPVGATRWSSRPSSATTSMTQRAPSVPTAINEEDSDVAAHLQRGSRYQSSTTRHGLRRRVPTPRRESHARTSTGSPRRPRRSGRSREDPYLRLEHRPSRGDQTVRDIARMRRRPTRAQRPRRHEPGAARVVRGARSREHQPEPTRHGVAHRQVHRRHHISWQRSTPPGAMAPWIQGRGANPGLARQTRRDPRGAHRQRPHPRARRTRMDLGTQPQDHPDPRVQDGRPGRGELRRTRQGSADIPPEDGSTASSDGCTSLPRCSRGGLRSAGCDPDGRRSRFPTMLRSTRRWCMRSTPSPNATPTGQR